MARTNLYYVILNIFVEQKKKNWIFRAPKRKRINKNVSSRFYANMYIHFLFLLYDCIIMLLVKAHVTICIRQLRQIHNPLFQFLFDVSNIICGNMLTNAETSQNAFAYWNCACGWAKSYTDFCVVNVENWNATPKSILIFQFYRYLRLIIINELICGCNLGSPLSAGDLTWMWRPTEWDLSELWSHRTKRWIVYHGWSTCVFEWDAASAGKCDA